MYEIRSTKSYRTSYKRISRQHNFQGELLDLVINTLAQGGKLSEKYHDHQLVGELKDYRECHIMNDLLLVYQKHDGKLILLLVDIGTHSSLFK